MGRTRNALARIRRELRVYRLALADPRTPWVGKAVLGLAVAYLLSPVDIIPDFIPVLGHLDDVLIVPGLVMLALMLIPRDIIADCRRRAEAPDSSLRGSAQR